MYNDLIDNKCYTKIDKQNKFDILLRYTKKFMLNLKFWSKCLIDILTKKLLQNVP